MSNFDEQFEKVRTAPGFIAALDQSGGSTPKALRLYGVPDSSYTNNDEMFDLIHEMRSRIISSTVFDGNRILGVILFENTMERNIGGVPTAQFLWEKKNIAPFLKVDKGLEDEKFGVQLMKPIPGLEHLLMRAKEKEIFGTKMRSFIKHANAEGINAIVDQQFEIGKLIIEYGLVPILEPEVDIKSTEKEQAEMMLKDNIVNNLNRLGAFHPHAKIMLKLTLPTKSNLYDEFVHHPNILKVVALSGGYTRLEANTLLAKNQGVVASFSRALSEGLTKGMTGKQFDSTLDQSIQSIFEASMA